MSSDEARKAMARSFGDWLGEVPDGTTLHVDGIPVSVELAREAFNPAMAEFVEKSIAKGDVCRSYGQMCIESIRKVADETFQLVTDGGLVTLDPARVTIVRNENGVIVGYLYDPK